MKELTIKETEEVNGGFKINLGTAIAGCIVGFITGGPIGLGYAIGTIIVAQGVNNLEEMYQNEFGH
jgi:lactobin A/cerein 7B family class IIb bacteriocin